MSKRSLHGLVIRLDAEGPARLGDQVAPTADMPRESMASIKRFADHQAHHLGNLLLAVTFCLKHLRGQQRTRELEQMVERGFHDAEQGLEAMRQYMQAMRVLQKSRDSSHSSRD